MLQFDPAGGCDGHPGIVTQPSPAGIRRSSNDGWRATDTRQKKRRPRLPRRRIGSRRIKG
ncbi:hypothetical protein [Luteimonas abyssi]|uniref:hypothetical protein n=1 Tax=Luteimonas abyssi TaxID=1247514 RepID=UPI00138EE973|nr:hypothetical protein [Luteimonas abyssi]